MLADDQKYFSWMARAALGVMMAVVMFWIRGQVPDSDAPNSAEDVTIQPEAIASGFAEHSTFAAIAGDGMRAAMNPVPVVTAIQR